MGNTGNSIKRKKKVMIVDDDIAILDALSIMLEDAGYEVETTIDGSKLLQKSQNLPDVVLLDIWMSGVNGRDICKRLKTFVNTKDIPVIMISANKDTEKISKESGADDFLTKPFEMKDLLKKVALYA